MKKRTLLLFSILPFIIGFFAAYFQGKQINHTVSFIVNNIQPRDMLIAISNGDIYKLTQKSTMQITHGQHLIEPVLSGSNFLAIAKNTNYASLVMFDQSGSKIKTLFNGDSGNIDSMSWISDPSINANNSQIAYVSDKDRLQTNTPDNALYLLNLSDGKSTNIANPAPYSGGIAHPVFNPSNQNILLYDYYQYDPQSLNPYSTLEEYNKETGITTTLTFENLNAYQEAFSPDGKQLLFLGRNEGQNTVSLYIADLADSRLLNIHKLLTGDIAYPTFSNTKNYIYYLSSEGNKGYNLVTAVVQKNKLVNFQLVADGFELLGNSSYSVVYTNPGK